MKKLKAPVTRPAATPTPTPAKADEAGRRSTKPAKIKKLKVDRPAKIKKIKVERPAKAEKRVKAEKPVKALKRDAAHGTRGRRAADRDSGAQDARQERRAPQRRQTRRRLTLQLAQRPPFRGCLRAMASAVWVTAGAPLQTGDGWRVWYSWPGGDFTPATPRVRTPGGTELQVTEGPWQPKPPPTGSTRRMGVRELRLVERHARRAVRGHAPRGRQTAALAHAPDDAPARGREPADRLVLLDQRRPRRLLRERGQGARPAREAGLQDPDGRPALRRRLGAAAQHASRKGSRPSTSATGATTPTASCSPPARRSSAATTTSSGTTSRSRRSRSRCPGTAISRRPATRSPSSTTPTRARSTRTASAGARSTSRRSRSSSPTRARTAPATTTRTRG